MGLDTSHGCWHGAYSAFHRWRMKIAEVAGIPLPLMEGFFGYSDWTKDDWTKALNVSVGHAELVRAAQDLQEMKLWPLPWSMFKDDPLVILLHHSDCDGDIPWEKCGPLANRLYELLPKLEGDGGGHIGNYREKTRQFYDGLRLAFDRHENVEFH